ncbi:hypothetical protein [Catenulispora subtropica]|uniref:Uncharacterized protein n=1 Tax=Catenulispora subtropica TaxID=450798 RepID=A0ABN2QIK8_9ACTN
MPDRGDERGRGGTRTLVTGILAGTEWHPADNPQEATQTAREARDLAVRLRPVLSKLAQAPRGGRRRDLDWLPAVEQLAVDAQYFASWWLPRLEGKSAQSWPSWSADGYADWVKRLDAQRVRTLEMVQGTTPVTRIASVTQLRRGKGNGAPEPAEVVEPAEPAVTAAPPEDGLATETVSSTEPVFASGSTPDSGPEDHHGARHARNQGDRTARIMPIRGSGAPVAEAAATGVAAGLVGEEFGSGDRDEPGAGSGIFDDYDAEPVYGDPNETHVPRTPPNTGPTVFEDSAPSPGTFDDYDAEPVYGDPNETHVPRTPPNTGPTVFDDYDGYDGYEPAATHTEVPHSPPFTGPDTFDEPPRVPRTPPFTGPGTFEDLESAESGESVGPAEPEGGSADLFFIPRTPPNTGPDEDRLTDDANATHISPRIVEVDEDPEAGSAPRPLFRDEPHAAQAAPVGVAAGAAGAMSLSGATATRSPAGASRTSPGTSPGAGPGPSSGPASRATATSSTEPDEFEYFQPGTDFPPPVFPQTPPTEPVDRGRIVRYAAAAVVVAAAGVLVVYAANQKHSGPSATPQPSRTATSTSIGSGVAPGITAVPSASQSSVGAGAVTAPTATDSPAVSSNSSTSSKPAPPPPPATSAPASSTSHTTSAPPPSSAAPPASHSPAGGGGGSGVSSLSVGSLAPDQAGSYTYTAHVHVVTRGTGPVTVTVTFAGSQSGESPGSIGAQSDPFTLSGKTSYDLTPSFDVHGMCPSPYIDVVVTASGASSAVSFASSPC